MKKKNAIILVIISIFPLLIFSSYPSSMAEQSIPIKHVVIIIQENHSFDNYFGTYPGANGLAQSIALPLGSNTTNMTRPYHLTNVTTNPLCNSSTCAHAAFDNGKMDGFLLESNSDLPFGYYDSTEIPYYWDYASQFVLLDNYYTSVMGSSIPNHLYLLTGQSGTLHDNPPWGVDTRENITSITDELDKKSVAWRYYYGFTQPFQWIKSFEVKSRLANIVPEDKFISDVANNNLPNVSWITPTQSEHPPLDVTKDQHQVVSLVNAIMQSNYWNSTAIFITWDDWGGWYDHVSPPQVDKFGYGFRAPLLVISPYAKQGFIDHTLNDHTSILKFIENLYSLPPLAKRDAAANNLLEPFNFSQPPRTPLILPGQYVPDHYPLQIESNPTVPEFGQLVPLSFVIALVSILLISRARFWHQ